MCKIQFVNFYTKCNLSLDLKFCAVDLRAFGKVFFQESAKYGKKKNFIKLKKKLFQPQRPKPEQPGSDQLPLY
jgi:hypothetical protein